MTTPRVRSPVRCRGDWNFRHKDLSSFPRILEPGQLLSARLPRRASALHSPLPPAPPHLCAFASHSPLPPVPLHLCAFALHSPLPPAPLMHVRPDFQSRIKRSDTHTHGHLFSAFSTAPDTGNNDVRELRTSGDTISSSTEEPDTALRTRCQLKQIHILLPKDSGLNSRSHTARAQESVILYPQFY